jgi:regulatory protein
VLRKRPRKRTLSAEQSADIEAAGSAAVVLLARRDFCSRELRQLLVDQGYEAAVVGSVMAELGSRGYIDDARYAQQYVRLHAERGQGPVRIERELKALGIEPELVRAALSGDEDWHRRARELRIRRFGLESPTGWADKARQARFLQYRGFSNDHIRSALGSEIDDLS